MCAVTPYGFKIVPIRPPNSYTIIYIFKFKLYFYVNNTVVLLSIVVTRVDKYISRYRLVELATNITIVVNDREIFLYSNLDQMISRRLT